MSPNGMSEEELKRGRPSVYTEEIADRICERLGDGESLRSICEDDEFPHKATVFRWLRANESFRDQYARAREIQAETLADEIIDISDDGHNDWMLRKFGEDERYVENGEAIRRSVLRIEARKWVASKLLPKKYGERIQNVHTDADGGPVKVIIEGDDKGLL